jgi:hypothetical protein
MRRVSILLVLAACVLAAAACGGGKKSANGTTASTTTSTTSTAGSTTTTSGTKTSPAFASGKCKDLAASAAKIGKQLGAASQSGNLENVQKQLRAFVAVAPSEIRGDVRTIADAVTKYVNGLKGVHLTPGKTPTASDIQKLQALVSSINEQKVRAAEAHIEAWAKKNCT